MITLRPNGGAAQASWLSDFDTMNAT